MSDWLLLRLPHTAKESPQWLLADAHGMGMGSVMSGTLAEASQFCGNRRVCVLVDSSLVLTADVELPVRGSARALQVAPFALEEQLVGDLEQQHFAVGQRDPLSGRTPVSVVSREQMQEWADALAAAGINADCMCAENALLSAATGQVAALLDGESLSVANAASGNVPRCLPATELGSTLLLALGGVDAATTDLQILVTSDSWRARNQEIEALRPEFASLTVRTLSGGVLPWFAALLPGGTPLNLLQGSHQQSHGAQHTWQRWRLAAALALGLLALNALGRGFAIWQLHKAEQATDTALTAIAAQLLPGVSVEPENVRRQVQQRMSNSAGGSPLLTTLQALTGTLVGGARLVALSFRDGTTELKLQAPGAPQAEQVNQGLRAAGLHAELTAGNVVAGGYEAQIQVKGQMVDQVASP